MTEHSPRFTFSFNQSSARKIVTAALDFFRLEAAGGILLMIAAVCALVVANTPLYAFYDYILHQMKFSIGFSADTGFDFELKKSVLLWINDGLMAIFFLLVGLEIKKELTIGALSNRSKALLPAIAAIGGMLVPGLIFVAVNHENPEYLRGWAIPCATDIAFALAVLSLLGSRVPVELKVLLTAIAILDDLGAILIIALFYTENLNIYSLILAFIPLFGLFVLNKRGVSHISPYIVLGCILWLLVLKSGVHATMAGVITALFIPVRIPGEARSPNKRLEHGLHPWVAFLILPLFGFANAGVPFHGMGLESLSYPVTLGIILGLVVGKQLGIFGAIVLAIKAGWCPKPEGTSWIQLYAVSILCGIGFTMSLFIGGLAFDGMENQAAVRLGVLVGSIISAIMGYILLLKFSPPAANDSAENKPPESKKLSV
jgi:Na+:H+ antiporter, NhaA family